MWKEKDQQGRNFSFLILRGRREREGGGGRLTKIYVIL
jgi:hypothetical protein